ncbi:MAG: galactokinase [Myxococcota bacterium]|nr:galactokinase [Myxococcota bacterium]
MAERPAIAELCAAELRAHMGGAPDVVSWAPGRINVIGGHTDYNGGLALPGAINRWISVALRRRADDRVRVRSLDFGGELSGDRGSLEATNASWSRFVVGCITVFEEHTPLPSGLDAVFAGDVPDGAGLSSSAALTVAWMTALRAWTGAAIDDATLVRMAQQVEHRFLGVQCGLLDQIGSLMAEPDSLLLVDFADLRVEPVSVGLKGVRWVVLHSGVRRELAGSSYLDRVHECAEGLAAVRRREPGVSRVRDASLPMLRTDDPVERRLRHVITENARVLQAADAVRRGDAEALGQLLVAAHSSLRDDYEVSCPQLDCLVDSALAQPGCFGARMVGGGFGGCTLNVVEASRVDAFIEGALTAYRSQCSETPRSFAFDLVGGAAVG